MARKSLLTESEIRRFMKLAEMRPIGEKKLQEFAFEEQEELPPPEGGMGPEGDLPPEEGEEELDVEDEPEADPEKEALLADVVQAVADVLGVEVDVEGVSAEEEEVELEPGEIGDVEELPPEGGEEMDLGGEELPPGNKMYEIAGVGGEQPKARGARAMSGRCADASGNLVNCASSKCVDGPCTGAAEAGGGGEKQVSELAGSALDVPFMPPERGDPCYMAFQEEGEAGYKKCQAGMSGERYGVRSPQRGTGQVGLGGVTTEEQIVNEVAKRVAARLSKEAQQDQLVDQLAERILKRLTK